MRSASLNSCGGNDSGVAEGGRGWTEEIGSGVHVVVATGGGSLATIWGGGSLGIVTGGAGGVAAFGAAATGGDAGVVDAALGAAEMAGDTCVVSERAGTTGEAACADASGDEPRRGDAVRLRRTRSSSASSF
jgi:hypothetical protein